MEAALNGEDPAAIGPAVEAATAAAPPEIADAVAAAIAAAPTDGPPSPEFNEAYGQVVDWMVANCGYNVVEVLATEYEFGGIPAELPAGPTIMRLTNDGEEVHELLVVRKLEGVTEPFEELLALPDEEAFTKIAFAGATFAQPGEAAAVIADLPAGEYLAVCFIPVGTTADVFAEMMAAGEGGPEGTAPEGTEMAMEGTAPMGTEPVPHFMEGMLVEFTVGDGAAAPATTGA